MKNQALLLLIFIFCFSYAMQKDDVTNKRIKSLKRGFKAWSSADIDKIYRKKPVSFFEQKLEEEGAIDKLLNNIFIQAKDNAADLLIVHSELFHELKKPHNLLKQYLALFHMENDCLHIAPYLALTDIVKEFAAKRELEKQEKAINYLQEKLCQEPLRKCIKIVQLAKKLAMLDFFEIGITILSERVINAIYNPDSLKSLNAIDQDMELRIKNYSLTQVKEFLSFECTFKTVQPNDPFIAKFDDLIKQRTQIACKQIDLIKKLPLKQYILVVGLMRQTLENKKLSLKYLQEEYEVLPKSIKELF